MVVAVSESTSSASRRVVHLPVYYNNLYQPKLMEELRLQGWDVIDGGSGGTFFRTALFKWRMDVLHFHWLHPYLLSATSIGSVFRSAWFVVQILMFRIRGCRIVWTVHNFRNHEGKYHRIEHFFTRRFASQCDAILAHCHCAADEAIKYFKIGNREKVHVVPHASYEGCYSNNIGREAARVEFQIPQDVMVYLFLGRILPYKGVLKLIDAFEALTGEVLLVLAGKGADEDLADIRKRIGTNPRIQMHAGYVPDDKIQDFMAASDVVVFPFRDILSSGSIALAMTFGKPCIAPAIGCVPELLDDTGGFLYDVDDKSGLLTQMQKAQSAYDDLSQMGDKNRQRAVSWTFKDMSAATGLIYEKICR